MVPSVDLQMELIDILEFVFYIQTCEPDLKKNTCDAMAQLDPGCESACDAVCAGREQAERNACDDKLRGVNESCEKKLVRGRARGLEAGLRLTGHFSPSPPEPSPQFVHTGRKIVASRQKKSSSKASRLPIDARAPTEAWQPEQRGRRAASSRRTGITHPHV